MINLKEILNLILKSCSLSIGETKKSYLKMTTEKNIIIIFEGKTYNAQEMLRKIKAKYGENPIITEDAKKFKTIEKIK